MQAVIITNFRLLAACQVSKGSLTSRFRLVDGRLSSQFVMNF